MAVCSQCQAFWAIHSCTRSTGNGTQVSGVYAPDMIIDVDADTRTLIILNASTENNVTIRLRGDGGTVKLTGHAYDCTGAITMQFEEDTDTFRETETRRSRRFQFPPMAYWNWR